MPPRKTPAQSVMEAGLKRVFGQLADREGLIRESGLHQALLRIGYRPKKGEVANMIWEVDEKCDGTVTWEEFTAMFHRCMNDKTGLEPRRLFQVVEFMMHGVCTDNARHTARSLRLLVSCVLRVLRCPRR